MVLRSPTFLGTTALGIILECIFYGVYMVLFTLYLVLRRRNNRDVGGLLLTLAQILLFCLCTVSVLLDISVNYFTFVLGVENTNSEKLEFGSMVIFATIDYLAQMILLYRCWIVWGRRWAVVAVPGFLALVTLGGGFALAVFSNPFLWSNVNPPSLIRRFQPTGVTTSSISLVVNALTTLLIITKIFITSREVRSALGSDSHQSFRIATAMLIESGLLMFAVQLVYVVIFSVRLEGINIISSLVTQIYGITPTLLHIRVAMGSAYDKTTEKTRSLRFAHSGGAATQTAGLSTGAAGVQSQGIIAECNGASNDERDADDAT
ncbi:hypothetical protein BD779DRAFT_1790493 [Infundibulicybe gibba]|nr:hypothetical protein BD779DRAFT_1790493 [Infundibulicybe gibba]